MKRSDVSWLVLRLVAVVAVLVLTVPAGGTILWSDFGPILAQETDAGKDILRGAVRRDRSASDTLYFKFHVAPISDWNTESYQAGLQLFEGAKPRLGVGNAWDAWSYSAWNTTETQTKNKAFPGEYALRVARGLTEGTGGERWEYVSRGIERTIVFKVQYVPKTNALITVWVSPDLGVGATEKGQDANLVTHFRAEACFDQIRLNHSGGGGGWVFSDMAIATSFNDFVAAAPEQSANVFEREKGRPPFEFRSWQQEQGLPQRSVNALAQDNRGYLWLGTDEGLVRFDGVNFVSFGLADGLPRGGVRALLADPSGVLWIGTASGGVARRQNGRFLTLTKRDGLPGDSVTALTQDDQNRIWIGTSEGLAVWENGKVRKALEEFSTKAITGLLHEGNGKIWVSVTGAGVFQFTDGKMTWSDTEAGQGLIKDARCLLRDGRGRLWVGAGDGYLLCRDNGRWMQYRIPHHTAQSYVKTLALDSDGALWIGSTGEGLLRFWRNNWQVVTAVAGLTDNSIESLLVDRQGNLWVGAKYGLSQRKRERVFVFSSKEGLGYGAVQGVAEVAPGLLWIGKADDGLYRWDGININPVAVYGSFPGYPQVRAVLAASDGTCWVAGTRGLWHFFDASASAPESVYLSELTVNALCESQGGVLLGGTQTGQLWRQEKYKWTLQTNAAYPITCLWPEKDGAVWMGTEGGGLFRLKNENRERYGTEQGMLSESIRALHLDKQGALWIGTAGGGLSRLRDGTIATFTTREGLPDNTVVQIIKDDAGRLWLGTEHGIASVSTEDLEKCAAGAIAVVYPQVYGREDGMLSEQCSGGFSPVGLKTGSGLLCFPTEHGLMVIDPRTQTNSSDLTPAAVIEQFAVDGTAQQWEALSGNTQSNAPGPLRLASGNHRFEFRYTALNFPEPRRVHFRYQLEGLDAGWVEAGVKRGASYSYLPPGAYRFRVQACGTDGLWQESAHAPYFLLPPPFWKTWWFIGFGVAGLVAAVVVVVRAVEKRKHRRRMERLEYEHALERERSRIAQDLHDEIGSTLCRISYLSEKLVYQEAKPAELRQPLTSIAEASRKMLQTLDHIVWTVNPKNDRLENLPGYLGRVALEQLETTGIECAVKTVPPLPPYSVSSHLRYQILLVMKEALANILKHSKATQAAVQMQCEGTEFVITVSDNGVGFDPAHVGKPGSDGLDNMRRRMTQIGGRCDIESHAGRGATVRFTIPLKHNGK